MSDSNPKNRTVSVVGGAAFLALAAVVGIHYATGPSVPPQTAPVSIARQEQIVKKVETLVAKSAPVAAATSSAVAESYVPLVRKRPSRPPLDCDDDDRARAMRYSLIPGYAYLASRCDIIHAWKADPNGGDVVIWLANQGYDSPAADCDYVVQVMWKPGEPRWPLLLLTYHGKEYEQPVDTTIESHPQEITFRVPCYADRVTGGDGVFRSGARTAKCVYVDADPAKGRVWDLPADGKCGEPPP